MDNAVPTGRALPRFSPCRFLISLDFDGTLWRGGCSPPVPPAFFEQMEKWRGLGVRWGINTGRTMAYLCEDWKRWSVHLPDFICTCERYVFLTNDEGCMYELPGHNAAAKAAAAVLQERMKPLLHAELERIANRFPHLEWIIAPTDPLSVEAKDGVTMDILSALLQPLMDASPDVSMQRADRYMRLADARFHKGSALAHVVEEWNVPYGNILIAGDGHNDIAAFNRFPGAFCAAPADAHPEVCGWLQSRGGYVSPIPGILQILEHWGRLMNLNS